MLAACPVVVGRACGPSVSMRLSQAVSKRLEFTRDRKVRIAWPPSRPHLIPDLFSRSPMCVLCAASTIPDAIANRRRRSSWYRIRCRPCPSCGGLPASGRTRLRLTSPGFSRTAPNGADGRGTPAEQKNRLTPRMRGLESPQKPPAGRLNRFKSGNFRSRQPVGRSPLGRLVPKVS